MNINLSISAAPGITNFLIAAVYEASNPGVAVSFQVLPKPLVADVNITFTDLNPVVHYVKLWENTSAAPGGTIRNQFIYDPEYTNQTIELRTDLYLTVGAGTGNPVAGTSTFSRADLADWDYSIERRGFGSMQPGIDVDITAEGETFTLIKEDGPVNDVFGEGEVFILHFEPRVNTNQPIEAVNSGRVFSATETLTENTVLLAAGVGKAYRIQSDNDTIEVTLPAINTMPENRHLCFISEGGNHINATIKTAGSDTIEWQNGTSQKIILGQSERIWLYVLDGVWVVSVASGNFDKVGEIFMSFDNSVINAVFANGGLLDRDVYSRLWEFVQGAGADIIVTDANWNNLALNNKGKFSYGDGSTTFRVPLLYSPGFLRGVDGAARKAGSYEGEMVGPHTHEYKRTRTDTIGTRYENNSIRQGSDRGLWTGDTVNTSNNSGTENRPANVGVYFMIRA